MDNEYLKRIYGLLESGATLGTGAVSGLVGLPYGLYKGVTSGAYGTPEAPRIAAREAQQFMERNTYQPRTAEGQENLRQLAGLLEASKLPPVMPEASLLAAIPKQAYAAQAERAGMAAEKAIAPVVTRTMERGGLPAQLLGDLSQGSIRPMDVWHGSPYMFEKFDASKIGTGEGAQMYGKGTYLAQQQEVAKRFTPRDTKFEDALMSKYNQAEKSGDYASMQVYEDFLTQKTPEEVASGLLDMGYSGKELDSANKALETAKKLYQEQTQGALYKVDLPDTYIRRMIDWDAPLKDQPYNVRNLAEKYGMDMNDLGGDLVWKVGKTEEGQKIMQDAGIPGIKYFDQMARGDEKNARNFVVFDPEKMTILERNAKEIKKKQSLLD